MEKFCARDGKKKPHPPGTSMPILDSTCFSGGLGPDFTDQVGLEVVGVLCTSEHGFLLRPTENQKPSLLFLACRCFSLFLTWTRLGIWDFAFLLWLTSLHSFNSPTTETPDIVLVGEHHTFPLLPWLSYLFPWCCRGSALHPTQLLKWKKEKETSCRGLIQNRQHDQKYHIYSFISWA